MKKIITVFDGGNFSETAINFIRQYPGVKKPLLVGVFLSAVDYSNLIYPISMAGYVNPVIEDTQAIKANTIKFKKLCEDHGIEYKIHFDAGANALENLKQETIFADLLIISSELFYKNIGEKQPGEYMRNTLRGAECPILLLPEDFDLPVKNILTYDGSETAAYAIKQFSYIFPEWRGNKTLLVYANNEEAEIPEYNAIKELIDQHFPDSRLQKLDIDPKKYFNTWLMDRKNAVIVAGGYGRKGLSGLFHKSFITEAISDHHLAVFITHK